ncbi:hypothetical protein AGRHK599_LOCUS3314 [Rhizobium rhizogenes]|uniref:Uncharacterized protein n=1 Tax=Rhizobium rhizogenes TaxID=359 RepID=A0AAN2A5K8_RHIRH|nr:hypothetical protein AGRHK599_LOCUS3314 [Rhizobium rhizogenes]
MLRLFQFHAHKKKGRKAALEAGRKPKAQASPPMWNVLISRYSSIPT